MELIHTCYRITEPERSVAFYEALGLEKRRELPIRDRVAHEVDVHYSVADFSGGRCAVEAVGAGRSASISFANAFHVLPVMRRYASGNWARSSPAFRR